MKYLVTLFKHKWIVLVLMCCINILAIYISQYYIIGHVLMFGWMMFKRYAKAVAILFGAIAFLHFCIVYIAHEREPIYDKEFIAVFTDEYKINGQTLRGFIKDEHGQKVYMTYTFQTEEEKNEWQSMSLAGIAANVAGEWQEEQSEPHEFAFKMDHYLKSKGAIGPFDIQQMDIVGGNVTLRSLIAKQRYKMATHIDTLFPPMLAQEAKALLIGLQDGLDAEIERAYQKLGITHLFAISGLHVALLTLLLRELLIRCGFRIEVATILLLLFLPLYALLAGGAPSIWRAVLLVEVVGIVKLLNKTSSTDDALSFVCLFFLTISPYSLFQVGFQLSYLATFSLIYSGKLLNNSSNFWSQNFMMTFVCQLLTYPFLLFHFYELSLSSFFANVVFVPLFSFIIVPLNLLLVIISYLSPSLLEIVLTLYKPMREWLNVLLIFLKDLPYQMWVPGKPSLWEMGLLIFSASATLFYLDHAKWKRGLVTLLIPILIVTFSNVTEKDLIITFINVGQGDSILIELPYRKQVILIDSGGLLRFQTEQWKERDTPYEVGRQVVVPYLKGKGIAKIDTFILTHADADHVEGAEEVLKEIRVGEIHISPNSYDDASMEDVRTEVEKRQIPVIEVMAGGAWQVGEVHFAYLSPPDTVYEGNNDSLVLWMQYGSFRALFTGDLEAEGELALIEKFPQFSKDVTVLKAGHHGSKTSSSEAFIEHTNPLITVFMAGENNRYGHPAKEVLERFESRNLRTYTTGLDGTVEVAVTKGGMIRSVVSYYEK